MISAWSVPGFMMANRGVEEAARPFGQHPGVLDVRVGAVQELVAVDDPVAVGVRSHVRDAEPRHPHGLVSRPSARWPGRSQLTSSDSGLVEPVRVARPGPRSSRSPRRQVVHRPRRDVADRLTERYRRRTGCRRTRGSRPRRRLRVRVPRDGDRRGERRSGEQDEQRQEEDGACRWDRMRSGCRTSMPDPNASGIPWLARRPARRPRGFCRAIRPGSPAGRRRSAARSLQFGNRDLTIVGYTRSLGRKARRVSEPLGDAHRRGRCGRARRVGFAPGLRPRRAGVSRPHPTPAAGGAPVGSGAGRAGDQGRDRDDRRRAEAVYPRTGASAASPSASRRRRPRGSPRRWPSIRRSGTRRATACCSGSA